MVKVSPQREAAMTADQFKKLLDRANLSRSEAAELFGVTRRTVIRWATGATPIDKRNALYIRAMLRKR